MLTVCISHPTILPSPPHQNAPYRKPEAIPNPQNPQNLAKRPQDAPDRVSTPSTPPKPHRPTKAPHRDPFKEIVLDVSYSLALSSWASYADPPCVNDLGHWQAAGSWLGLPARLIPPTSCEWSVTLSSCPGHNRLAPISWGVRAGSLMPTFPAGASHPVWPSGLSGLPGRGGMNRSCSMMRGRWQPGDAFTFGRLGVPRTSAGRTGQSDPQLQA
jgi:hypothetical protein